MLSLLEAQYGHIIPPLTQSWGAAAQRVRFIRTLLVDDRWDCNGLPADAW